MNIKRVRCVYCGEEIALGEAVEVDCAVREDGTTEKWYSCRECAEEETKLVF